MKLLKSVTKLHVAAQVSIINGLDSSLLSSGALLPKLVKVVGDTL